MNTNYRVCYEGGNSVTGKKIYELQTLCNCSNCRARRENTRRGVRNQATATTKDINKIDEVAKFLEGWRCGETGEVKTAYYQF